MKDKSVDSTIGVSDSRLRAKKLLLVYAAGTLALIVFLYTPLSIPCLSKLVTSIPCPGCGLTRSFLMAAQFDFMGAVRMNILFLPLSMGMLAYFVCAVLDAFADKRATQRLDSILNRKWIIAAAALFMIASGYYNIIRAI